MHKSKFLFIFFGLWQPVFLLPAISQDFLPLVQKTWQHNNLLKAKNFQLESAGSALAEAKALYAPEVSFGMQYTLASGGRTIDVPVGDLLNPVYSTLNNLTQTNAFPSIQNASEQFFPNNFYDARIRVTQAVYYPDLAINKKMKKESFRQKELEVKAYKRLLAKETMTAWFTAESAKRVIHVYLTNDTLLNEVVRSTKSMIQNGIALSSALSRIEIQQSGLKASLMEAETNRENALSYYTFVTGETKPEDVLMPELPSLSTREFQEREEIQQMDIGKNMFSLAMDKENAFYLPRVGAQLDLGSQDFDFGFQPYVLFGLNLEMNLFDAKKHLHRKSSFKSEYMAMENQKQHAEDQFTLQREIARKNTETAINMAQTFQIRIQSAEKLYTDLYKKYREGSANYLELLDAQTQVTQIKIQYNLARYNAWIKWAEFVYASAAFPIL